MNIRKQISQWLALTALTGASALPVQAHTPLFDCFDGEEGMIVCEAGFSDGASAEGIDVRVMNAQGRVLQQGKIAEDGSVTFKRPDEEFSVQFAAGEEHTISVIGDDIY